MGTYRYTLRAKTVRATIVETAESIEISTMKYAYKDSGISFMGQSRGQELAEANVERHAQNAWENHSVNGLVPYAMTVGDKLIGGEVVHVNLKSANWYDTNNFPAEKAIGYLMKKGNRYYVVKEYTDAKTSGSVMFGSGGAVPFEGVKYAIVDGNSREVARMCQRPNKSYVWIKSTDKEAHDKIIAEWKPVYEALKQAKAKEEADRKAAIERNEKKEELIALEEIRAITLKNLNNLDMEIEQARAAIA